MIKVLVVVNVQNYFINENTKDLPDKIRKFIEKNEKSLDYVLFTKFVNNVDSNFVKLLNWKKCFDPPENDVHPSLQKFLSKNNVFKKTSFSAFKSKEFSKFLKDHEVKDVLICGTDTEACVFATAIDAFDFGYNVKVMKNLCGSHHGKKLHNAGCIVIRKSIEK